MKKLLLGVLVLLITYIGIRIGFHFFEKGHEYEYYINNKDTEFLVKEKFIRNTKNEIDGYYFEIIVDDIVFSYQTFESFGMKSQVITDIRYYKDNNLVCILPIFLNGKVVSDIKCLKDNIIYNYRDLNNKNSNLKSFVETLGQYGYNEDKWIDNATSIDKDNITIYKDNLIDGHYISLDTYKGIYILNAIKPYYLKEIKIFNKDIYTRPISTVFKNYYVVADYNAQYRFNKFYIVDLITQKVSELSFGHQISFDSYIQGTNDNSVYLFDKNSKKQYEINLKTNKVSEIGNETLGIKIYQNDAWNKTSAVSAKNDIILFDDKYKGDVEDNEFERIDKVGGTITGYYYFYKKIESEYFVYRSPILNRNQLTYLYKTTDIKRMNYVGDFVYYIYNNEIRYFNEQIGVRTVIENKELSFNNNLMFSAYIK